MNDVLSMIWDLKTRISNLEKENVELTNELYELQNKIDMIENPRHTLNNINLGK